jgi:putative endonuclease
MPSYVYILTNRKHGALYIGVTTNLIQRVQQHKEKSFKGFTARYGIDQLVYYETYDDLEFAIQREKQLKHWERNWKIALFAGNNPDWKDLFLTIN